MKKVTTIILILVLSISSLFSISVFASEKDDDIVVFASTHFAKNDAGVRINSDGEVEVEFTVKGKRPMDEIGVSKIVIQEKYGTSWSNVKTFSSSTYSSLMTENDIAHSGEVTYNGKDGYMYRAKVTFYAEDSSGSDERTVITDSVTV